MKFASYTIFILLFFSILISPVWAKDPETSACLDQMSPLINTKNQVEDLDGIWGLFQKNSDLELYSIQSLNLDKGINSILFNLNYLCNTLNGIPLDELSDYVSKSITVKGEARFKKELIDIGRNVTQVNIWIEYSKFAVANQHRVLLPKKMTQTLQLSKPHLDKYREIAETIRRKENISTIIIKTENLIHQIDEFLEKDPYLSLAIYENSQIPYVDWDENHGGS
jgi:hypothetical protein